MRTVDLVLRKYGGLPHRQVTGRLLGTDEFGVWVATPQGSLVTYHYGSRATSLTRADAVRLIPSGGWWQAMFLAEPDRREVYCDVTTPAAWTGAAQLTVIDLDIDVVRYRADRRVEVEDEDEFEEHRRDLGYPPDVVQGALAGAKALHTALTRNDEPFATHYRRWLELVAP